MAKPNNVEFVVRMFVIVIVLVLVIMTLTAAIIGIFTDKEIRLFVYVILQMTSSLIVGLIGYITGRSVSMNGQTKP